MYLCAKSNSRIISWLSIYYYWIVFLMYLASIYISSLRVGFLASFLILLFAFTLCIRKGKLSGIGVPELVILFALYNIFSLVMYLYNGIPLVAFVQDFSNQFLPMIFFFLPSSNSFDKEKYYNSLINSIIFCIVVGLYFYILKPSYYFDFLAISYSTFNIDYYLMYPRFYSIVGSTIMGSLSLVAMIISLNRIYKSSSHIYVNIALFLMSFVSAILTMQRSTMAIAFIILLTSIFITSDRSKIAKKYLILSYLFLGVLLAYNISKFRVYEFLVHRLKAINSDVITSRSHQWIETIGNSQSVVFGSGLGSVGHKALGYAKHVITDGSLFKIFAELGIIGFLLFGLIIFLCLVKAFKHYKSYIREIAIIFVFIIQSIGSNTLSFQILLPIFWLSLGIITYDLTKTNNL